MAQRYDEFLDAGVRLAGLNVDSAAQNAAMIHKLRLPFAMLSDPDGTALLGELGAFNPDERGGISRPGVFVFDPDGTERYREVSRDFADRVTEDELLARARALDLVATTQPPLAHVDPRPGDQAMPVRALPPYIRGAKFAAKAMGMRHPEAKADSKRFVEQMDRYADAVRALRESTDDA